MTSYHIISTNSLLFILVILYWLERLISLYNKYATSLELNIGVWVEDSPTVLNDELYTMIGQEEDPKALDKILFISVYTEEDSRALNDELSTSVGL